MNKNNVIPEPPHFTEEELRHCKESGDYKPVLFEWYKFVTSLGLVVANIQANSPAFKKIPPQHYYVLAGLVNRCARLMMSNMALSHEGKFGEAMAIIDRCIFESAIKISWLCREPNQEKFVRYLADGLKTEIEFKKQIKENIRNNNDVMLPIEKRMLISIDRHISLSGLTETEIIDSKKLHSLDAMIESLNFERLFYVVGQKIGSHHVHGTWSSLLLHYLEDNDDKDFILKPNGDTSSPHINQFLFAPFVMLGALKEYVEYSLESEEAQGLVGLFDATFEEIIEMYKEAGEDAR